MWVIVDRGPRVDQAPSYLRLGGRAQSWTAYPADASTFDTMKDALDTVRVARITERVMLDRYSDSLPCGCEDCNIETEED